MLRRRARRGSCPRWRQFNKVPVGISSSSTVNNNTIPGLLTGEGGRKLAGMDLSRSFCSATMKGSFKCSGGTREREHRRVDHWAASVDENPKVHAGHTHNKRPFLFAALMYVYQSISVTWPRPLQSGCFHIVDLIFQLNSRAHHECQTLELLLPWWHAHTPAQS